MENLKNKKLIILVGPMGAGKTTMCKDEFKDFKRISQDDEGKIEHFKRFLKLIKDEEPKIILDRINHLRKQREKYIEPAKKAGYEIEIIILNEKFEICYKRISKRKLHPNLNSKTDDSILIKALNLYFNEYQIPVKEEADKIIIKNKNYDPYMLDLSSKFSKFFIIGDVHGCQSELKELIEKANLDAKTAIIFCGDLFDKGPNNKKVLNYFNSLKNSYSITGNHENKLIKYLMGKKIIINNGLDKTIEDFNLVDFLKDEKKKKVAKKLMFKLQSFPFIIKLSENDFVVHGGINPLRSIEKQSRRRLMFTRTFNLENFEFANDEDKFWFEFYDEKKPNIYFGHHKHDKLNVKKNVFSMDGNCVYGEELRGLLLTKKNILTKSKKIDFERELFTVKAKKEYYENKYEKINSNLEDKNNIKKKYDNLINEGLIKKTENEDLVLYSYTDKCSFKREWNKETIQARGIIYDKKTYEIVARPFPKFFNLGENELSSYENLPKKLKYEVYEKVDGSLGILFNYKNKWQISTRGSFTSDQANFANKLLKEKYNVSKLDKNKTYLLEIIYPQNKIIVDYKNDKKLVLLGIIDTKTSYEENYEKLQKISKEVGFELCEKFNHSIKEMIEIKKSLPAQNEGFIVKYSNNFRVKIKGDEYLKIARILSNSGPLAVWEKLELGKITDEFLETIPEEILDDVKEIKENLEKKYQIIKNEILKDIKKIEKKLKIKIIDTQILDELKPKIGKFIKENKEKLKHSENIFPYILSKEKGMENYILKKIRPNSNKLD